MIVANRRASFVQTVQPTPIPSPIIRWLVYSHVWMALCAAAQVWWTFMYMDDRSAELRLIIFTFLATVSAYNFMRLMRAKGALADSVPLFQWVDRNRVWQWIMVVISGSLSVIFIFPLIERLIGILWWIVPICLLYVLPFGYPKRYLGLRAIPALKVPIVGLVWAMVTVIMPGSVADDPSSDPISFFLFIQRFLFVMALTIAFDIRDSAIDPPGLRTVPQLFGDHGARWIAIGMIMIATGISIGLAIIDPVPDRMFMHLLPLIGMFFSATLVQHADRSKSEIYYGFIIDGLLILLPLLAWIGQIMET